MPPRGWPAPESCSGDNVLDYIRDGAEIYRRSFSIIRAEADLSAVPADLEKLALRIAHASGMVDVIADLRASPGAGARGRAALADGAAIVCDSPALARGITRSRLPADNAVRLLSETENLAGTVLAVGSDPAIIEGLATRQDRPALVLAFPVGFAGEAEAKAALAAGAGEIAFVTLLGTRGGTAMAAAAVNALATERE